MISIKVTCPAGEQHEVDILFLRLPQNEDEEDTVTDLEIEMSLTEIVPRSSTHSRPVLGPGYGLKDWIRFCRRSQNLVGSFDSERKVSLAELAKHCTEDDAWTAINGRVYNITPYLKYHPGSVQEVMRGAGKDCTSLFNEYHSYVQYEKLLSKCYVGKLVLEPAKRRKMGTTSLMVPGKPAGPPSLRPPTLGIKQQQQQLQPVAKETGTVMVTVTEEGDSGAESGVSGADTPVTATRPAVGGPLTPDSVISDEDVDGPLVTSEAVTSRLSSQKPRCDWYQSKHTAVLCIYTYTKGLKPTDVIIDVDNLDFCGRFFLGEKLYQITGNLPHPISRTELVFEGHKVDIIFHKVESGRMWQSLDLCLDTNGSFVEKSVEVRRVTLASVESVSHDTRVFTFALPRGSYLNLPTAHHMQIMADDKDGEPVVRSYTPVCPISSSASQSSRINRCDSVDFMIKLYPKGKMSAILNRLEIGDSVMMTDPEGDFKPDTVAHSSKLFLIAAGSGLTPMTTIARDVLNNRSSNTAVKLLFANKTEGDILCKDQLREVESRTPRFDCVNILSNEPENSSWTGPRGRMSEEFLSQHIPPASEVKEGEVFFCICGMSKFQSAITSMLENMGYSKDNMKLFD